MKDINHSLKNKIAVVCGSTQGIGKAIAEGLANLQCKVILLARNEEKLRAVVKELPHPELQHIYFIVDFQDLEGLKNISAIIADNYEVNILVNNTGGPPAGPIVNATEADFQSAFTQHLLANHVLASAFITSMKNTGYGRIVNVISTSVKIPLKGLGVSNTIRSSVANWSKTMANELGEYGITVNNVLPGATMTSRLSEIIKNKAQKMNVTEDEVKEEMLSEIPMHRFGSPEDIANMAVFLCSPYASYVNGVSIAVDGGRTGTI